MRTQYTARLGLHDADRFGIHVASKDAPVIELTKVNPDDSLKSSRYHLKTRGLVGEASGYLLLRALDFAQGKGPVGARESRRTIVTEVEANDTERIDWLEQAGMSRFSTVVKGAGERAIDFIVLRSDVATLRSSLEAIH